MKNKLIYLVFVVLAAGCQPDAHKEAGEVRNIVQSLGGTWKLTKVTQRDEEATLKGFPFRDLDLTSIFPYSDFVLTLNVDGSGPTTYSSTQGNAPQILKTASGAWVVDDPIYPGKVTLGTGASADVITLGSYPVAAEKNLSLTVQRKEGEKLVMSYIYEFTKQ
ncbi:MAG: DUF5004 domain-containing protein [Chitinophagaceae bacterium]|nr:MAG: DUF5004 domain-containing protein [Chitinophagaceae bacterium]